MPRSPSLPPAATSRRGSLDPGLPESRLLGGKARSAALHREVPGRAVPEWLAWSELNGVGPGTILRDEALLLKDLDEALPGRQGKSGQRGLMHE